MKTRIIGIAGPSGSGKTTIGDKLVAHYGATNCVLVSADNYYKDLSAFSLEERSKMNFDCPDMIDLNLLAQHIQLLRNAQSVEMPVYDFKTHTRTVEIIKLDPKPVMIVEGILVFCHEALMKLFDIRLFVKTDLDLCLLRRIKRDIAERGRTVESVLAQYEKTVRPMYKLHIEPTCKLANIVVKNNLDDIDFEISELLSCLNNTADINNCVRRKLTLFANTNFQPENSATSSHILWI